MLLPTLGGGSSESPPVYARACVPLPCVSGYSLFINANQGYTISHLLFVASCCLLWLPVASHAFPCLLAALPLLSLWCSVLIYASGHRRGWLPSLR